MDCLFCKIINSELDADIVYNDDELIAIRDVNPQAPTHILIIPKTHIATINDISHSDTEILVKLIYTAKNLAHEENIHESGYRLVWNVNSGAGQSVFHIHLHLLGGRIMNWPPG